MSQYTQPCRPLIHHVQRWLAAVAVALLVAPPALAAVWFADSRVATSGNGASWPQAKKTVGEAIAAAVAGDEIWVATGAYVQSITLKQGVALYGGFAGTETQRDQRNPASYPVQIGADAGQVQAVYAKAVANIRLDGFTVKGGWQASLRLVDVGSTAVISNCVFRGSSAEGVRCYRSSPVIEDCLIHNNGDNGLYCYYGSPHITRCSIAGNNANAILMDYGSPTITDTLVVGNKLNAVYLNGASSPTLTNCLIVGQGASALYVVSTSAPTVTNCTFVSNTPSGLAMGGAILTNNSGKFTLRNTVFFDNSRVAVRENSPGNNEVSNCLFRSNTDGDYFDRERWATFTGAAAINTNVVGASGTLDGDPLFHNVATGTWTSAPVYDSATCRTTFTDASATYEPGTLVGLTINCDAAQRRYGLITANTETAIEAVIHDALTYVQSGDLYVVKDFRILEDSACVDVGVATDAPATDLEGNARPMDAPDRGVDGSGTEYDIGVYEYQPDFGPKTLTIAGIDGGGTVAPAQGGIYDYGTPVQLQATPKRGCTFDRWLTRQHVDPPVTPIERSGSDNPYALSMVHDWDVWAYFTGTPLYVLNLSTLGPGAVSVIPQDGPYAEGTSVTLEATPNSAARFLGWQGSLVGTTNPSSLTMDEDKSVEASFVQTYTLTTQAEGSGTIQPADGTFDEGTSVALTAVPEEEWRFDHWAGALQGATNPASLTMDGNENVTAVFIRTYPLAVTVQGEGSVEPNAGVFDSGTTVTLAATADEGWRFDRWEGDASGAANPLTATMDGGKAITAVFIRTYALTTSVEGGGSIEPNEGTYDTGSPVTLTATANEGWRFDRWEGAMTGSTNPAQLTVDADKAVTAVFIRTYALATSVQGSGSMEPDAGVYDTGATIALTATPDEGWRFDRWEGAATGSTNPANITMDADKAVTAVFIRTYTLTTATQGNGSIEPNGGTYDTGSSVSLSATPEEGWRFDRWEGGLTGSTNPAELTMDADKAVTAVFIRTYTLATAVQGGGSVVPAGGTYATGTTLEVTAIPTGTWVFDHWLGAAAGSANPVSLTMNGDLTLVAVFALPPAAGFTATPTTGLLPLNVQFTDASVPGTESITAWAWDFNNDGATDSTAQNPSHTYTATGTYAVSLTVTSAVGADTETKTGFVEVQELPNAEFSSTLPTGRAPFSVSFTDASTSVGGLITAWAWDFDNNGATDSTAQNPSHDFSAPGVYTVKLTVTNAAGSNTELKSGYVRAGVVSGPQPEGSFGELYDDLVPPDAQITNYDADRFAVVTGLVRDIGGSPISGVEVTFLGHSEFGTAYTDASGSFSLPVEGGGSMTAVFKKQGYISSQRSLDVPWTNVSIADPVTMLAADTTATTMTLDGNPASVYSHRSSTVSDSAGSRACTLVFTGDTSVSEVDAAGNVLRPLTHFTVRATEFRTEESMPAQLPPTSAYTYCVELNVDGAEHVQFNKPAVMWVDNFLGFAVGELVPVGAYDREEEIWKPEKNGVVVRLLDTGSDGVVDALDATGDNVADDLDGDTETADEVMGLNNSQTYAVGATFWRAEMTHFTPWDLNWPYGPPADAIAPPPIAEASTEGDLDQGAKGATGEFGAVTHKGRVFHEDIPIAGTGVALHYASDRTDGYKRVITIPVSDDTPLPSSLKRMRAVVEVGGRVLDHVFTPALNQTAQIEWDGLDWLGRSMPEACAEIRVEYVYAGAYFSAGTFDTFQSLRAQSFAQPGIDFAPTLTDERMEFVITRRLAPVLFGKRSDMLADGWTLSNHHRLATFGRPELRRGDGETVSNPDWWLIDTVLGTGRPDETNPAPFSDIQGIAFDAAGNLYATDMSLNKVFKVARDGSWAVVAGVGTSGYSGDGGQALSAQLDAPRDVAVDAQGRIFIADTNNQCIRKVDLNGVISTIAGGTGTGFAGDNGPSVYALLSSPQSVAVNAQGDVFIADTDNNRVRKVNPAGIITTYAGDGYWGTYIDYGDGGPATAAAVRAPRDLFVDAIGNVYTSGANRVRKIDVSGFIWGIAGTSLWGEGGEGDNGDQSDANLQGAYAVAVDQLGNVYLSEHSRIRRVDPSGAITTFIGTGEPGYGGDGGLARQATLNGECYGLAIDAQSRLYIADHDNHVVRRVGSGYVDFQNTPANGELTFAEANGTAHIMDATGKHLRTIDQATGKSLAAFNYDANGAFASETDLHGETLTIQRNAQGVPTAIVSPDGVTTALTIDGANHLTAVSYPDSGGYTIGYGADGLLETISANGRLYDPTYNVFGRVDLVLDPLSHLWNFSGQPGAAGASLYSALTPEQDQTSYANRVLVSGAVETSITDTAGLVTTYEQAPGEASEKLTLPTGTELTATYGIDPLFHFKRLDSFTTRTPGGLALVSKASSQYADSNFDGINDQFTYTQTVQPGTAEERSWTSVNDTLTGTAISTSPLNRVSTTLYDTNTLLPGTDQVPGLCDAAYQYDTRGRLTHTGVGTRGVTYAYNTAGNLASVSEPVTGTVSFAYDVVGRITGTTQPDGTTTIGFEYDANHNGNLASITLPTLAVHSFGYDTLNRNTSYTTPSNRTYTYVYDNSNRLTGVTPPSGAAMQYNYALGRLTSVVTPDGTTSVAYDTAGRVQTVSRGAESVTLAYDGDLPTSRTLAGTLNQAVSMSYYADFSVASLSYAGATQGFAYDADDLLTGAGSFTITRRPQNGLLDSLTDGTATVTPAINGYGEATGVSTVVNGATVSWSTTLDNAGRITGKTEVVGAITTTYGYTYDALGHLSTVTKNGIPDEAYTVDGNGRRTLETNASRGIVDRVFTYDAEDRLFTAGDATYTYDEDGFLATKTVGQATTAYAYTRNGALKSVTLPDATLIEYVLDSGEQRIAKKVNGVITEKYLWAGLTGLLAVYDGADNLLARFEYADGPLSVKMVQGGATYYLAYDQVGSLRAILNANGAVVHQITFDTFGNILTETASGLCVPFGFAGGFHDRATGLVRFGYRDYDPDTGRWTAKDPIGPLSGDLNLYEYCTSDPVNLADPSGLLTFDDVLYHAANFSAGIGDSLSFGATQAFRGWQMGGDVIDTSSGAYKIGVGVETAAELASGLGAVLKTGAKQAGRSAVRTAARSACFVEGTEVSTDDGFVHIEDLEVGDRVLTSDESDNATEVDPVTWRKVELRMPDPTGAKTAFTVSVLRPLSWLQEVGADIGHDIWFELPEMGVRGEARVVSISDCPSIEDGPGRVVLGTVQSVSDEIVELTADGLDTPVCATPRHLFYSVDRSAWVQAAELAPGERLKTDDGSIQLTELTQCAGRYTVYNLEVETDHDYFVTQREILVHNVNPCAASQSLVKEGIYEFIGADGVIYVGQSGNLPARIARHIAEERLPLTNLSSVKTTEVLGGKTSREIAEQLRIIDLGGVDELANINNPIGRARASLLPPEARHFLGY